MLLAQSGGAMSSAYQALFFFGPLWVAIAVWLALSLTYDYLRKIRERQMASDIVQSMLANPKNSAEDIERVLTAWWGGNKGAAKAAKDHACHDWVAAEVQPVKMSA